MVLIAKKLNGFAMFEFMSVRSRSNSARAREKGGSRSSQTEVRRQKSSIYHRVESLLRVASGHGLARRYGAVSPRSILFLILVGSLQPARVVQLAEKQVRDLYWNLLMVWRLPVRDNNRSIHVLSTLHLKKLAGFPQTPK